MTLPSCSSLSTSSSASAAVHALRTELSARVKSCAELSRSEDNTEHKTTQQHVRINGVKFNVLLFQSKFSLTLHFVILQTILITIYFAL